MQRELLEPSRNGLGPWALRDKTALTFNDCKSLQHGRIFVLTTNERRYCPDHPFSCCHLDETPYRTPFLEIKLHHA
jgi:hypothetical protein